MAGDVSAATKQAGYHKRLKAAHPLLCKAILVLAERCPSWFDELWMTDATSVPDVFTRVARRLLAMAAVIWHNWTTGKRSLTTFKESTS